MFCAKRVFFYLQEEDCHISVKRKCFDLVGKPGKHLHFTTENVPWEMFEERFYVKYLSPYFQEQEAEAFHMLVQGNKMVEEYEIRFMELVKYVPYLDTNECQAKRFVYGLNSRIKAMVRMWKPSSIVEVVECARYAEEHLGIKRDVRPTKSLQPGFPGKTPRKFFRGNSSRPPPYGNRFTQEELEQEFP